MHLSHALIRSGNAVLVAWSAREHWVIRYTKLALVGGCPPTGTHDQTIVDVYVDDGYEVIGTCPWKY